MSNDRSREALGRFLDFLGEKGLMSPATAQTRKASALRMLSILSSDEAADVTVIDVDEVARRFNNIHGQKYNPSSVLTYRSRLQSALSDFQSYLKDPLSFKPAGQAFKPAGPSGERSSRPKKDGASASTAANVHEAPAEQTRPSSPPVMAGANVMPIPIRADLTILIHGLPHDLTQAEAKKIAGVVTALAT